MARRGLKRSEEETAGGSRAPLRVVTSARGVAPGVRSICPFCGNSEQTTENPCCEEWLQSTPGETTAPAHRWLPRIGAIRSAAGIERRMSAASQLLVMLLASCLVALCVSVGMQHRLAEEPVGGATAVARAKVAPVPPGEVSSAPLASVAPNPGTAPPQAAPSAAAVPVVPRPPRAAAPAAESATSTATAPEHRAGVPADARPAESIPAPEAIAAPEAPPAAAPKSTSPTTGSPEPRRVARVRRPQVSPAPRPEARPQPAEGASDAGSEQAQTEPSQPVVVEAERPDPEVARRVEEADAEMKRVAPPPSAVQPQRAESPWSRLRRGMSPQAVRALLGDPRWKRLFVTTEWWLYKENSLYGTGWVNISVEEGVTSWREP